MNIDESTNKNIFYQWTIGSQTCFTVIHFKVPKILVHFPYKCSVKWKHAKKRTQKSVVHTVRIGDTLGAHVSHIIFCSVLKKEFDEKEWKSKTEICCWMILLENILIQ